MKNKVYCPMCGNTLDPKIHVKQLGKTKKEIERIQEELLKNIIKVFRYVPMSAEEFFGESVIPKEIKKEGK